MKIEKTCYCGYTGEFKISTRPDTDTKIGWNIEMECPECKMTASSYVIGSDEDINKKISLMKKFMLDIYYQCENVRSNVL